MAFRQLRGRSGGTDSLELRGMVQAARTRQAERFGDGRLMTNATMTHREVEAYCQLDQTGEQMLKQAMTEFALSARAHDKICKVARTIADLDGASDIQPEHIAEAVGYRRLDRKV